MRNFPTDISPPEFIPSDKEPEIYTISVITPMFGGGVVAGENDNRMLIRSMSIRGHLRFWWRATRGKSFNSVSEMRESEQKIWGSNDTPSNVEVKVNLLSKGTSKQCANYPQGKNFPQFEKNYPAYFLFPFQGNKQKNESPKYATNGIEFELQLSFPESLRLEVEAAVWAWVNFGGIGARTRRGCGALFCEELAPKNYNNDIKNIKQWFQNALTKYKIENKPATTWSTLANSFYVGNADNDAMNVWNQLAMIYRNFRQGENVGRNPGQERNRPGRSRWSEAETIRNITKQSASEHRQPYVQPRINAFPRAEFGLPMITHFKDRGEPADSEINHPQGDRMSSPLILRPLKTQDGQIVPLIMRLQTQPLQAAILKQERKILADNIPVTVPELTTWQNSPLHKRTKTGSALEAFLQFACEQKYEEVRQ